MEPSVAIVTGGTRGIGLGIASCLVRRGSSVAVTYSGDDRAANDAGKVLEELAGGRSGILVLKGDAGDPAVVSKQYDRIRGNLGPASILVNNAGIMPVKSFENLHPGEWDETIRVNLSSAFYWSAEVVPHMKSASFGRIVNISSIAARGGGVVGPHYAASKAGLLGFTRYAARELGPSGITVNAIAPAFIEDAGIFTRWTPERLEGLRRQVVVPRIGKVSDVVRAFEYLLDSPFVTGITLDVNGGSFIA